MNWLLGRKEPMKRTLIAMAMAVVFATASAETEELTAMQKWIATPGADIQQYVEATQESDNTWRVDSENIIMKQIDTRDEGWWFVLNVRNCWVYYVRGTTATAAFANYTANTNSYGFNFAGRETEIAELKKQYGIIRPWKGTHDQS